LIECSKCGLDNLDHVSECAGCGASLEMRSVASMSDYYPPRAGRFHFLFVLFYKLRRNSGSLDIEKVKDPSEDKINFSIIVKAFLRRGKYPLCNMILPGLGHIFNHRYFRGCAIFSIHLFFLLLGVFFYGRTIGNIFWGCALSLHAIAIYDSLPLSLDCFKEFSNRVWTMILILIINIAGYYYMFGLINSRLFGVWINVSQAEPVVNKGEFILIRKLNDYNHGDIAIYYRERIALLQGAEYLIFNSGLLLNRIIGCPGDTIEVMKDRILVNNNILTENMLPIGDNVYRPMKIHLKSNQYFIYDSITFNLESLSIDKFKSRNIVEKEDIRGRVFMVYAPYSKMRFIE